jgi:sugar lactone lactonase YvrE
MTLVDLKNEIALKAAIVLAVIFSLTGCGGNSSTGKGSPPPPPAAAKNIYVIQNSLTFPITPGSVLQFSTATSGNIAPENTIIPPDAGDDLQGLTTDAQGNLYVSTRTQTQATTALLEYSPGANGTATPIRNIPSNNTTMMFAPDGLAISPTGQIIVGEDSGAIATYSANANGDVAPEYFILGPFQISNPLSPVNAAQDVAMSASGDLYVFNWNDSFNTIAPIDIFAADATGNVAPIGTIGGSLTGLSAGNIGGIAIDSTGNVYISTSSANGGVIKVFAPTANGNVAPIRTISGSSTQLGTLGGIQLDAVGNIYVISTDEHGENPTVLRFPASASGNVAPTLTITSSAWTYPDDYFSLAVY